MSADAPASPAVAPTTAPTTDGLVGRALAHALQSARRGSVTSVLADEVRRLQSRLTEEREGRATAFRTLDEMRARFVPLAAATYTAARTWREMDPNTERGQGDRLAVQLAAPFGFVAEMDTLAALARDGGR